MKLKKKNYVPSLHAILRSKSINTLDYLLHKKLLMGYVNTVLFLFIIQYLRKMVKIPNYCTLRSDSFQNPLSSP